MSLTLVLEHAPHQQTEKTRAHEGGDLTIGRGDDAGWKIDDPEKYVSRRHCVISGQDGQFMVTDASTGGLFIDGSDQPLGPGNSAALEHGMRLRMGDYVIRVELDTGTGAAPAPRDDARPPKAAATSVGFEDDDFFSAKAEPVKQPVRPDTLPDPFEGGPAVQAENDSAGDKNAAPPQFDDVFTLDPVRTAPEPATGAAPSRNQKDEFFAEDQGSAPRHRERDPAAAQRPAAVSPPKAAARPVAARDAPAAAGAPAQADLFSAFIEGLGLGGDMAPQADPAAEMEALGKRFRLLVDGLMHLLRTRAQEKQNVRVAQTIIGAQDVNPLKFLATTDDALEALLQPRGKGYLTPDAAIESAFQDLADHQMRTWAALQTALRRMIDRFNPDEIEKEMEDTGLLEALLAGGRSAKLWQLYQERYDEIAKAAEERFLGEVGADFRDAYEQNRRR